MMDTELLISLCKSVKYFRSFLLEEDDDEDEYIENNMNTNTTSSSNNHSSIPPLSIPKEIRHHSELQSLFRYRKPYKVPRIHVNNITPLQFLQQYVIPHKPVILLGATNEWNAHVNWIGKQGLHYLSNHHNIMENEKIYGHPTCTFTPNGRADAIYQNIHASNTVTFSSSSSSSDTIHTSRTTLTTQIPADIFVQPEEQALPFSTILSLLQERAMHPKYCDNCNKNKPSSASSDPIHSTTSVSENNISSTLPSSLPCGYAYLSVQNDNLRQQLPYLLTDLGKEDIAKVHIGTEALGNNPDAINIWIGYHGNISSIHKDHYENLLTVIAGVKRFVINPPSDILWLYEKLYPTGKFIHNKQKCTMESVNECSFLFSTTNNNTTASLPLPSCWSIQCDVLTDYTQDSNDPTQASSLSTSPVTIPWISIDPANPDYEKYPLSYFSSPITVDVHAGETFYLPSLWYHQVSHPFTFGCQSCGKDRYQRKPQYSRVAITKEEEQQYNIQDSNDNTGMTIAINSWYDMNYLSQNWAYFNTMKEIANSVTRQV